MKTYLFTYNHDGAEWILELKADSPQDARARLAKLAYARLDGELKFKIPAPGHLLGRIWGTIKSIVLSKSIANH